MSRRAAKRLAQLSRGDVPKLMVALDALGGSVGSPPNPRRHRHDWVRGDVRCLMCGRLLGRLLGTARSSTNGDRPTGHPEAFFAFRPLHPEGPMVPFTSEMRFRCVVCGGVGALDDVEVFSTYDEI